LEASVDGIIDVKIHEGSEVKNLMRITSMRGVGYDYHAKTVRHGAVKTAEDARRGASTAKLRIQVPPMNHDDTRKKTELTARSKPVV